MELDVCLYFVLGVRLIREEVLGEVVSYRLCDPSSKCVLNDFALVLNVKEFFPVEVFCLFS